MRHSLLASLLILACTATLLAQQSNLVVNSGITSPLHKANIGKIRFAADIEPAEHYTEADFLDSFLLKRKADLNLLAFMDNSLTNYLHTLAPNLQPEQLVLQGNYQFTFYVDGQPIYQENLHPGAGSAQTKNTNTLLTVPLLSTQNEHIWSRFLWSRFLGSGGEQVLTEGKHKLKIEIRPYVNNPELVVGEVIAAGQLELTIRKPQIDTSKVTLNKIIPAEGWAISKESFDSSKIRELKASIDEDMLIDITSLVVVKNGRLLIEEYFNGADRNTLHDTRSVGKSFASTLTGIALQEGHLAHVNQSLKEFYTLKNFAHYTPEKENITIKNLLSMSSAFDGNDALSLSPGNEENMYPTENWVKFTLDLPLDTAKPAKAWKYFTAGVVLLGDILHKTVPGGLEKYANEKLFRPLGITAYKWQHTPQGVANTAGSLQMRSLDYAKYGQLYKNLGKWNNKQILSKDWVEETFTRHKAIPERENEYYGYLFWNKQFSVNGKPYEAFYSAGNGGNAIFIFKNLPLVVVITATAYGAPYSHSQVQEMMELYVLPAVINNKTR
ncbi:serine hydrolase [Cesiribacter sp. SM1]|uniref:serine hydrolase domain-containing protein n=1 Tax=Cesiribacter sp. SM1 TaxID=2861196 RepID=UPI001CD1D701|nr:serine hydrolase [Cesiribacter sp. SM1]